MATPKRRQRPKAKPDVNQKAVALVQAITGSEPLSGEELLGSEELRKALRDAKAADVAKRKR